MAWRRRWVAVAVVIAAYGPLGACGGGPTLGEYAVEVEGLVVEMNTTLDEQYATFAASGLSFEAAAVYYDSRARTRAAFVDAFQQLEPAEEADVLHQAAVDVVARLLTAEQAFAAAVHDVTTQQAYDELQAGPLGEAMRTADEESVAICRAANDQLAETESRRLFQDVLWVPDELREVINVALKCTEQERAAAG